VVPNGNHADRPAWRVTSGEPAPDAVERLLRLLPGWFGLESSVLEYVAASRTLPAYLAWPDGRQAAQPGGVLLEADLIPQGVEFLQVKTQGPARPDAGYEKTRQFYSGVGFRPLEEIHGLWPGIPCLIMIKSLRSGRRLSAGSHPGH
jgi:hypothetical protein